jgi:hypothetical protein
VSPINEHDLPTAGAPVEDVGTGVEEAGGLEVVVVVVGTEASQET